MEANEFFRLGLALVLSPVIATIGYKIRLPSARLGLGIAYGAVVAGYVMAIAEDFVMPDLFNLIQHCFYAIGGIALVVSAIQLKRHVSRVMETAE